MLRIGQAVRFAPLYKQSAWQPLQTEIGHIFYINEKTQMFVIEYKAGDVTLKEAFKFCQIGKDVQVYGD